MKKKLDGILSLKFYRDCLGLTQAELGRELGLHRATIHNLENRKRWYEERNFFTYEKKLTELIRRLREERIDLLKLQTEFLENFEKETTNTAYDKNSKME